MKRSLLCLAVLFLAACGGDVQEHGGRFTLERARQQGYRPCGVIRDLPNTALSQYRTGTYELVDLTAITEGGRTTNLLRDRGISRRIEIGADGRSIGVPAGMGPEDDGGRLVPTRSLTRLALDDEGWLQPAEDRARGLTVNLFMIDGTRYITVGHGYFAFVYRAP